LQGNTSSASVSYAITYGICALYDQTKSVKNGATVPIRLQLCDANGADASSSEIAITAQALTQVSTSASGDLASSGAANPDNNFRFDATLGPTGGYIFNLSTTGLTTGTYRLDFTATSDPPHIASNLV